MARRAAQAPVSQHGVLHCIAVDLQYLGGGSYTLTFCQHFGECQLKLGRIAEHAIYCECCRRGRQLLFGTGTNNKQASKQATLVLSVLAITPFHRFKLYATLAILQPRWWSRQIQVLSEKITTGAPGQGRQVGKCPPRTAHFVPQSQKQPFLAQNGQTKGNGSYIARVPQLPLAKEPFLAL